MITIFSLQAVSYIGVKKHKTNEIVTLSGANAYQKHNSIGLSKILRKKMLMQIN